MTEKITKQDMLNHMEDMQHYERKQVALFSSILEDLQDENTIKIFQKLLDDEIRHDKELETLKNMCEHS